MASSYITLIVITLATYLFCGIPFGMVISRFFGHIDIRQYGSGNIGATNVARSIGKGAAALTLLLDAGKGLFCMCLARLYLSSIFFSGQSDVFAPQHEYAWVMALLFVASILGHVFSPYLNFHGGKGIAVGFGCALAFDWTLAIALLAVFLVVVIPTRFVSAASCSAAAFMPIYGLICRYNSIAVVFLLIAALIVIWAHRENLYKLLQGKEKKFAFHHDGDKPTRHEVS